MGRSFLFHLIFPEEGKIESLVLVPRGDELVLDNGESSEPRPQGEMTEIQGPFLVFPGSKAGFSLRELWDLLRPDVLWPPGEVDRASSLDILADLWRRVRALGLEKIYHVIRVLTAEDPLSAFFTLASHDMVLKVPAESKSQDDEEGGKDAARQDFDPDRIEHFFAEDGPLRDLMIDYRRRPDQLKMALEVALTLRNRGFLMAEAGTGVGKSFAYLVPCIYWAVSQKKKVVVATRTKALQKQLVDKDLPLLKQALSLDFSWQVAYGRENYLCLRRLTSLANSQENMDRKKRRFLASLIIWAASGGTGQLQDLKGDQETLQFWKEVSCLKSGCLGKNCRFKTFCFLNQARSRMAKCDILITNHALLLSDLANEGRVLPEYRYLVVDEAHNLERAAFDHLGTVFVLTETRGLVSYITGGGIKEEKESRKGAFIRGQAKREQGFVGHLQDRYPHLAPAISQLRLLGRKNMDFLKDLSDVGLACGNGSLSQRRLKPGKGLGKLKRAAEGLRDCLLDLGEGLRQLAFELADYEEDWAMLEMLAGEVMEKAGQLSVIAEAMDGADEKEVLWAEWAPGELVRLGKTPLLVGEILSRRLYQQLDAAVFVSATLTVGGSFDFIKERLGLHLVEEERLRQWWAGSPYDYETNCLVVTVKDVKEPGTEEYVHDLCRTLEAVITSVRKRTLVLFTSRQLLLDTAEKLGRTREISQKLICQYRDGEFKGLIEGLAREPEAVLLGAETFWEGVDLPGELLQCLVITRLPFRSPADPLAEATTEYLTKKRRNAFLEYSLPEAVLRFRQGVGRLLRRETDFGAVVVLDSRFCLPPKGKRYSRLFRESIPGGKVVEVPSDALMGTLKSWFTARSGGENILKQCSV